MAKVTRKRTTIWLDAEGPVAYDVHTEDDMLMIEADVPGDNGEEIEIMICPSLFPAIKRVIEILESRE